MHSAAFRELQLTEATERFEADTVTHRSNIDQTESTDETESAKIEAIEPSTSLHMHMWTLPPAGTAAARVLSSGRSRGSGSSAWCGARAVAPLRTDVWPCMHA